MECLKNVPKSIYLLGNVCYRPVVGVKLDAIYSNVLPKISYAFTSLENRGQLILQNKRLHIKEDFQHIMGL